MGRRAIFTVFLAAFVVACAEIPADLKPSPSGGGGFVPVLGNTPTPTARQTATTAPTTTATAPATQSATTSPSPTATASPTPRPAAELATKMLDTIAAQTAWTDKTVVVGLQRIIGADGTVIPTSPNSATTRVITAPNKRELTVVDNVTGAKTLHSILIGTDLYTEVAGIGWEQSADPGITFGRTFVLDSTLGTAVMNALLAGNASREPNALCAGDDAICFVLGVDFKDGTGAATANAHSIIVVDGKTSLPTNVTTKYSYSDGLFYIADKFLQGWGTAEPIAAPAVVTAAPPPSPTPTPAPTAAPTAAAPTAAPQPTPSPTPAFDPPNAPVGYSRFAAGTSRGTFTVYLIKEPLAQVTVKTVTANASDCVNCPAKPLAQYIGETGAFAGMNGSYFCPPDYADCGSTPYKYDYEVYNSYLSKWLSLGNGANGVATFNGKTPAFYATFNQYGRAPVTAGIANYPTLMVNGAILNFASQLSDAQNRAGTRGVIATNATYVFLFLVAGASVTDAAFVAQALGATNALNLDGGGSSALYIDGAYKVGPGRLLPNAVVLTRP